jgi:protein gp37
MSDLFHDDIPLSFIQSVFRVMIDTRRHTYQILTKRAERLAQAAHSLPWSLNIWMGVSVENQDYTWRIDELRKTPAHTKFLSLEPLLSPLDNLNLKNIDWVIVGGESGPNARPMEKDWVRSIQKQCARAGTKFFFKQWGGVNKKLTGRTLDGKIYNEYPSLSI